MTSCPALEHPLLHPLTPVAAPRGGGESPPVTVGSVLPKEDGAKK